MSKADRLNNEFYNTFADDFDRISFEEILPELVLKYLPKQTSNILEIGSGGGALALWLASQGQHVTCIEPAEKLAEKVREKGLNVCKMRFQDFLTDETFDVVLAISSLIHIPKQEMPFQLQRIAHMLKASEGIFILSFIEGDREECEDPSGRGKPRFFSKWNADELIKQLSPYFTLLERYKIEVKKMHRFFWLLVLQKSG